MSTGKRHMSRTEQEAQAAKRWRVEVWFALLDEDGDRMPDINVLKRGSGPLEVLRAVLGAASKGLEVQQVNVYRDETTSSPYVEED